MAKIRGVNVIAPVVPFDTADVHPSHEARYGKGGYRTVATLADRDAIPAPRREAGMLVFVTADESIYTLGADLTTWELLELGGGQPDAHAATHAAAGSDPLTLTVAQVTGLQSALDAKATPADVTSAVAAVVNAAPATLDTLNELAAALGNDASFATTVTNALAAKAPINSPTFTGTVSGVTKAMVGLGNVDNTSDASKPVSTAQAAADAAVASAAAADATTKANAAQAAAVQRANHTGTQTASTISDFSSAASAAAPVQSVAGKTGTVTLVKGDVGLGSVDNTSDASKPISTATQAALDGKASVSHTHSVGDITATGTPSASTFLRGDGEWAAAGGSSVAVQSDTVGSTSYIGRAAAGSATSASVWTIRRTILTSAGAVSSTATATNVKWDDRLTATYS